MKELWTKDEAEFHGDFVDFDPVWSNPKPVQFGGPPIWMGASSKWSYDRIAEYCDGWLPIAGQDKDHLQKLRMLWLLEEEKFRYYVSHVWSPRG